MNAVSPGSDIPAQEKLDILGLPVAKLAQWLESVGEKPFRAQQIVKWVHHQGVTDFDVMTNLSKALRAKLADSTVIGMPEVIHDHLSEDGTRKWALKVPGGSLIETVYIPEGNRGTLCVSSQVGCTLDCSFCATGKQGFQRDLTSAEIIGQVWLAHRAMESTRHGPGRKITNVVFMGMGEPLLNFEHVMDAVNLMMDDFGYGISKRRVTISTSGVVPMMEQMIGRTEASLAISLHAPNDALRDELVPVNRKYPIAQLLSATHRYMASLPDKRRVVTVEYTLIKGVNDLDEHAHQLVALLRETPCKINLIPFNPFDMSDYTRPSSARVQRFQRILFNAGYIVTVRTTRGDDIAAACGQLAGQVKDRTRRAERYRNATGKGGDDVETVKIVS